MTVRATLGTAVAAGVVVGAAVGARVGAGDALAASVAHASVSDVATNAQTDFVACSQLEPSAAVREIATRMNG